MTALLWLWQWYAQHLVFYSEGGWVASTARTFRVFAVLVIVPGLFVMILVRHRPLYPDSSLGLTL